LGFKNIKPSLLIGIALLISILVNLPRVLQLYNVVDNLAESFAQVTIKDIVIRIIFLFVFSWVVLLLNTNWKFLYAHLSKLLKSIITISANSMLFFLSILLFVFMHRNITEETMNASDKGLLYFVYFVVLVILVFISNILRYQITRQEDIAEKELLKQQSLQNELSALKNQINPHFLFNSLNSLNSLIRDNKVATAFVNKLSFMYRYILQSGHQDFVTLKEELKFLESYIYLIKTRYRDRFSIQIDIDDPFLNENLPALALQLLVENAVKHNEISESHPLLVKLYIENDYLVVENPIRPRTTFVDSTGQGLLNINKRYLLLKKKHISISDKNGVFKVKLPIN
jgi:LytS/YehU family sensor histidine kinase